MDTLSNLHSLSVQFAQKNGCLREARWGAASHPGKCKHSPTRLLTPSLLNSSLSSFPQRTWSLGKTMGIRILVADDEPDIVLSLSDRLKWLGHAVTSACDGQAALTALESQPVDLVFLDVEMPKLSGIEVLRRIRQRWPDLPVIILTAYGTIRLAVEAMKEGAVDFHHQTVRTRST